MRGKGRLNTKAGQARRSVPNALCWFLLAAVLFSPSGSAEEQKPAATTAKEKALLPLPATVPIPADNPMTAEKIALGKQLFFDRRLSGDNQISCSTCHLPEKAFGDSLVRGKGAGGKRLTRNTPGLLNVGFYKSLLWDGRAASLEQQSLGPIEAPNEMNQNLDSLEKELNAVAGYVKQFQAVFGTGVTREGIAQALAAFQRTLVSRDSAFDRYLQGDKTALSDLARTGMELFAGRTGCSRCHNGPLLSDSKFYRLGVSFRDRGREKVTGKKEDRYRFRTPTLRDITRTGPYMHDGSLRTLEDVVEFYYRSVPSAAPDGLSLDIEPLLDQSFTDIEAILAFLRSLDGKAPKIEPPQLP